MNTLPLHIIYHCILPFKVNPIFGVDKEWDNHEKELIKWKKEVITKNTIEEYAEKGYRDHIKFCIIEHGYNDWKTIAYHSTITGLEDIVVDMFNRGIRFVSGDEINIFACKAAYGGYKNLLHYFFVKGAYDRNEIAYNAARGGHKDIVDDLIEHGANNLEYISYGAAYGGHKDILYDLIERGVNDLITICLGAKRYGHYELAKEIREKYLK